MVKIGNRTRGWMCVAGCLMIDISVGEFNLLSFLYPYIVSYYRSYNDNISYRDIPLLPTVWLMTQVVTGPLSIYLYNKIGYRYTFFIYVCTFYTGQLVSIYITNFYTYVMVYGVLCGSAQGGLVILPLYCCWRYFPPSYKSIISGIILSAYAISPLFTSIIVLKIINPLDIPPVKYANDTYSYFTADVYNNYPRFLFVFGTICFVTGIIGILLILDPIDDDIDSSMREMVEVREERGSRGEGEQEVEKKQEKRGNGEFDIQMMRMDDMRYFYNSQDFRYMLCIIYIGFLYPNFVLFNYKQIGLDRLGNADQYLNYTSSVASLFNGGSRLVSGLIYQFRGFKISMTIMLFIIVTSSLSFIPLSYNKTTYSASLFYFFLCYGGQLGLYPLISHSLFKQKSALAYSVLFGGFTCSCLTVSFIHKSLTSVIGMYPVMILLGVASLSAFPFIIHIHKRIEEDRSPSKERLLHDEDK